MTTQNKPRCRSVHPLKTRHIVGGSVIENRVALVNSSRNQGVDNTFLCCCWKISADVVDVEQMI